MSGGTRIAARPNDLTGQAKQLRDAAAEVESIARNLRLPLPAMPAAVKGHVEGELGWALVALSQLSGALMDEARGVATRGQLFATAGEGGFAVALGGYLSSVDQVTDPWLDGLERVLMAPRYVRFGTWVRAYSYANKYGTEVNVGRHWRDLPNKLMKERPVFSAIGEDSALLKGMKIAGRTGVVLTFVSSGLDEWEHDRNMSTTGRVASSVTVGASTAGGALAGAEMGAMAGATVGSFVPVVGTAAGGVAGALIGGFAGSVAGQEVGHFVVGLF